MLNPFFHGFLGVRTWVEGQFTSFSCWPWSDPLKKEWFKKEKHGENATKLAWSPDICADSPCCGAALEACTGPNRRYPTRLRYVLFTNGCKRGYHSTNIHGVIRLYYTFIIFQSNQSPSKRAMKGPQNEEWLMSWSRVVLYKHTHVCWSCMNICLIYNIGCVLDNPTFL